MNPICYLIGDVTNPLEVKGRKILCHIVNDIGKMGAGVALSIKNKWPVVYIKYREWYRKPDFKLGEVQLVKVGKGIVVANMIGQRSIGIKDGISPIRYEAVDSCLKKVSETAKKYEASIAMPRICCGLAGGQWDKVEPLIVKNLCEHDIPVYVYDLGV